MIGRLADLHVRSGTRRDRDRPDDFLAECGQMGFREMGDHRLIVETLCEGAHPHRGVIAVIVRITIHVSGQPEGFEDPEGRGPRQCRRRGQDVDRRALQAVQFREDIESTVQSPNRSGGFACARAKAGSRFDLGMHGGLSYGVGSCAQRANCTMFVYSFPRLIINKWVHGEPGRGQAPGVPPGAQASSSRRASKASRRATS